MNPLERWKELEKFLDEESPSMGRDKVNENVERLRFKFDKELEK
jgi:hypothetical protein